MLLILGWSAAWSNFSVIYAAWWSDTQAEITYVTITGQDITLGCLPHFYTSGRTVCSSFWIGGLQLYVLGILNLVSTPKYGVIIASQNWLQDTCYEDGCVTWSAVPSKPPCAHGWVHNVGSFALATVLLEGWQSCMVGLHWNAFLGILVLYHSFKAPPRRTVKRAVELAFTVAMSWELSCRRASLLFSPGT